jgi:hypothetical protein
MAVMTRRLPRGFRPLPGIPDASVTRLPRNGVECRASSHAATYGTVDDITAHRPKRLRVRAGAKGET